MKLLIHQLTGRFLETLDKKTSNDIKSGLKKLEENPYRNDLDIKKLKGESWGQIAPLIKDCRTEGVVPEDKHDQAIALLMPEKIFRVSIEAHRFGVPWGCAYLRLKEMKKIQY